MVKAINLASTPRVTTRTGISIPPSGWLWEALVHHSSLPTYVVSHDGTIEYANALAQAMLSRGGVGVVGQSIVEMLGTERGRERLELIARVLRDGQPLTIEDMHQGRRVRCVLRPMPSETSNDASRHVLAIAHPITLAMHTSEAGDNTPAIVRTRNQDAGPLATLTTKELEILRHIAMGLSTQEIATTLGRSVKTIEWHRVSLGEKLGVENRVMLARIAIAAGLVSLDEPILRPAPRSSAKPA